ILMCASWCQVATGSLHASTANVHFPSLVGVTSADHLSVPGVPGVIGVYGPLRPCGSRSTTLALTMSWPSRKTVADTANVSPTTALAGQRPQDTPRWLSRVGVRTRI